MKRFTTLAARSVRLTSAGLLALALLGQPKPAAAVVEAPSTKWRFTLYADPQAEGSTISMTNSSDGTFQVADLRPLFFNDILSSWSFCNGRTWPVLFQLTLYTDTNYGGTAINEAPLTVVNGGECVTRPQVTVNDAASSYILTVYVPFSA